MKKRNFLPIIVLLAMVVSANGVFADDVYVAGTVGAYGIGPTYWKNGTKISLTGGGGNNAHSIFVAGSDVYIAGEGGTGAVYWKNAEKGEELHENREEAFGVASSVFVSGPNVYFAGHAWDENKEKHIAKYWQNGKPVVLPSEEKEAWAKSIFVAGSDMYVAGDVECGEEYKGENGAKNYYSVASYWKNGKLVKLTGGKSNAYAQSITVAGNAVYVAGFEYDGKNFVAKYWKNGAEVKLTDGKNPARAYSIAVSGSDVYVAGREGNSDDLWVAKYWKNGVAVPLPDKGNGSIARSIVLSGSDVYAAGSIWNNGGENAVYWVNGKRVDLTDESEDSFADSIFVVKK